MTAMKTVAVVFGGRSVEHDISIITGQFVLSALNACGQYTPLPVYVAKDGRWYSDQALGKLEFFRDPDFGRRLGDMKPVSLDFGGGLGIVSAGRLGSKTQPVDIVFPAMHGTYGEDGSLMGLLRMTGGAFVGCDMEASVIAMDKVLTKQVLAEAGLLSVPYVWFTAEDWQKSPDILLDQMKTLERPLFVKPAHLGSSIGITKVTERQRLPQAIEVALHYDNKVIVEQGVECLTEVNCAVLGNQNITTSELEQPLTKTEFLSFQDKYMSGGNKGGAFSGRKDSTKIPAPVSQEVAAKIKEQAILAFKAIGGSGTARLDFMVDSKTQDVYLNEINPLPGNLQQHLWKASGVSNVELVTRLVELAQERHIESKKTTFAFESSVLHSSGGAKKPV
jgi:D-alanine-D-alanine ligase